jgi:hypothetical protein
VTRNTQNRRSKWNPHYKRSIEGNSNSIHRSISWDILLSKNTQQSIITFLDLFCAVKMQNVTRNTLSDCSEVVLFKLYMWRHRLRFDANNDVVDLKLVTVIRYVFKQDTYWQSRDYGERRAGSLSLSQHLTMLTLRKL